MYADDDPDDRSRDPARNYFRVRGRTSDSRSRECLHEFTIIRRNGWLITTETPLASLTQFTEPAIRRVPGFCGQT